MSNINERIKSRRTDLGLTLLQIADALGVKEATVQRYESGEIKNIKHETIVKLSEILKCSPSYLMGWETEQKEKPIIYNDEREKNLSTIDEFIDTLSDNELNQFEEIIDAILSGKADMKKLYKAFRFVSDDE